MSSYWYNKNTWLVCGIIFGIITLVMILLAVLFFARIKVAILLIEKSTESVGSLNSVLFIPFIKTTVKSGLIFLFLTIASWLATSGSPEYRVVEACSFEIYNNTATNKMFAQDDICDPDTFADCTGCPKAQCVHHMFVPSVLGSWLQVWNICWILWMMWFVQSLGRMEMAGIFATWYWAVGRTGDVPSADMWANLKIIYKYQLGSLVCGSLVPGLCCITSDDRNIKRCGYINTAVLGWEGRKDSGYFDRFVGLGRVTHFILLTAKLSITGLVAAAATFATQLGSSLENHMNCQVGLILIVIIGSHTIASGFFSVYSVAVDTVLECFWEDLEKHDKNIENLCFMTNKLMILLETKHNENKIQSNNMNVNIESVNT
eukprot:GFUD01025930.1.p1 GENE.GFUD01025930.1~~GFUD01025930.1.p1  ORF type:complete len:425 (+),score=57.44 GFUD01025930.1:155-1276(+)